MAFTYDGTLDTDLEKVRLEIGDTDSTDALFTDAEINVKLSLRANNIEATAADLCDILAVRFARQFDFETDGQKFARSQRSKMYKDMAAVLRARANGGITSVPTTRVDGYSSDVTSEDVSTSSVTSSGGRVRQGYVSPDLPY